MNPNDPINTTNLNPVPPVSGVAPMGQVQPGTAAGGPVADTTTMSTGDPVQAVAPMPVETASVPGVPATMPAAEETNLQAVTEDPGNPGGSSMPPTPTSTV